jgi:hypothetical protein
MRAGFCCGEFWFLIFRGRATASSHPVLHILYSDDTGSAHQSLFELGDLVSLGISWVGYQNSTCKRKQYDLAVANSCGTEFE